MEYYYIAKKISLLSKIGEPFMLENIEKAQFVWKWIKNKKKFKICENTIWRVY